MNVNTMAAYKKVLVSNGTDLKDESSVNLPKNELLLPTTPSVIFSTLILPTSYAFTMNGLPEISWFAYSTSILCTPEMCYPVK